MIRLPLYFFLALGLIVAFTAYLLLFLPPDWAIAISVLLALLVLWLAGERRG
jgi:membrane protein implicated in regulation of membrane protease activity